MVEENISQEFWLKYIDETRNYFLKEIEQNELMIKKHKKVCTALNYIEHFLILASTITEYISIPAFNSLLAIPIRIMSSAIGLKICATTAGVATNKGEHWNVIVYTNVVSFCCSVNVLLIVLRFCSSICYGSLIVVCESIATLILFMWLC